MEKVIPAKARSLLGQLGRRRVGRLGAAGCCLSTAGNSRPAAPPPVVMASTARTSRTASVAVHRRDGGVLLLRVAGDGGYGVVVQLHVVGPHLVGPGAEKALVGHVRLRQQYSELSRKLLEEVAVKEDRVLLPPGANPQHLG